MFLVMLVLALVPGVSVLTVTARAITGGFRQAAITSFGIVTGDMIYIAIAVFGLRVISDASNMIILIIKYAGGAFLIWTGITQIVTKSNFPIDPELAKASSLANYLSGLAITLGDQKAIIFYLIFFPAFIDVKMLSTIDAVIVVAMASTAIFIAKLYYAYMATRVKISPSSKWTLYLNYIAGTILIMVGIILVFETV